MDFNKLLEECKLHNINDVELSTLTEVSDSISLLNGMIDQNESSSVVYGNVRAVVNGKLVSYYVENMSDDNIKNIVSRLLKEASVIESSAPCFMYDDNKELQIFDNEENDLNTLTKAKQVDYLNQLTKEIKSKSQFCKTVRTSLGINYTKTTIRNSKGLNKTYGTSFGVISCQAVVKKNNDTRAGYSFQYFKNYADIDKNKIYDETVYEALKQIGASTLPSKNYKVVFKNSAMNTLLRAFANQFYSEDVLKKMSSFDGKVGQKIFGDNVNIIDDPERDPFHRVPFDDEGVETYKKYVVKDGKLETYLYNLSTAKEFNTKSSGNGFKNKGFKGNVGVGTTNFYLEEGTKSLDEVFLDVVDGVYITSLQGAHAGINKASGDFNLQSSGYLIENGKLSKPVTLIIVSGNFFDMMNNIVECANDIEFRFGTGTASVYVNKLNISGK